MKIKINGAEKELDQQLSLKTLLSQLDNLPLYFVLALNYNCIPSDDYSFIQLKEGDEIEIVSPMQGG